MYYIYITIHNPPISPAAATTVPSSLLTTWGSAPTPLPYKGAWDPPSTANLPSGASNPTQRRHSFTLTVNLLDPIVPGLTCPLTACDVV